MSTSIAPTLFAKDVQPVHRTITWVTNYNNKMRCQAMLHIDLAPAVKPVRSEIENAIIEIYTADKSHPPIKVQLFDMLFVKLNRVSCMMTMPSHGMDEVEFVTYLFDRHPDKLTMETDVAVYYYKKIS